MPFRGTLELTPEDRAQLAHHREPDARPFVRERGAALLKVAAGASPHAVAHHGRLRPREPDTVYEGVTWYEKLGFFRVEHFQQGGAHRRSL